MKISLSLALSAAAVLAKSGVDAFSIAPASRGNPTHLHAASQSGEEPDFDAPSERAAAVGNLVKTPDVQLGIGALKVSVPPFIARAFGMRASAEELNSDDTVFMMDEECYLGREGNMKECADFDPKISP